MPTLKRMGHTEHAVHQGHLAEVPELLFELGEEEVQQALAHRALVDDCSPAPWHVRQWMGGGSAELAGCWPWPFGRVGEGAHRRRKSPSRPPARRPRWGSTCGRQTKMARHRLTGGPRKRAVLWMLALTATVRRVSRRGGCIRWGGCERAAAAQSGLGTQPAILEDPKPTV